jgi:apolipoprotein D and lipocalin family protein
MKIKLLVATLGLLGLGAMAQTAPAPHQPLSAIAALDVPRYLGTWYEIAKYPNGFEKNVSPTRRPGTACSVTASCRW